MRRGRGLRTPGLPAGVFACWLALSGNALADNCGTLSDCYSTARGAAAALIGAGLFAVVVSAGLDLIPGVGTIKGAVEAFTGRDLVTRQELAWWERALGIVPIGGALIGGGLAATKLVRTGSDLAEAAHDVDRAEDALDAARRLPPLRPSWRESELDVGAALDGRGYRPQVSFRAGEEVPYGTRGSVRPDHYRTGGSVEVKNYDLAAPAGRSALVRSVSDQALRRAEHLPPGTVQDVVIDVRGQGLPDEILDEVARRIVEGSGGAISPEGITFRM